MRSVVRPLAVLTAIASALAIGATAYWSRQWNFVTVTMLVALVWSATVAAVDATTGWRWWVPETDPSGRSTPITCVMRLGEERIDIARTSLVLAAQAGPVVVVATRHHAFLDDLCDGDIIEYVAPTITEALEQALAVVSTEAVLVLSASAFPVSDTCAQASGRLTDDVGWVIGRAPAFNNDRYAPGERPIRGTRGRAHLLGA